MMKESYDAVVAQFQPVSVEAWKNKIIKDLKGESFDKLIWHTQENIEVLPFYTKEDNAKYQLAIPEKQTENWHIVARVEVDDVVQNANKMALSALQNGATAIVFNLKHTSFTTEQIALLIQDIITDIAPVSFENFISEEKNTIESVLPNSCTVVCVIQELATITDELVMALQQGIATNATDFHFYIKQNYFFEIAKLRAFRWLWKQVCDLRKQPYLLRLHAETSVIQFDANDENYNILRNTTAAMSAIIGGCDSLLINSHDVQHTSTDFGKRIALNIQHILKHESYFDALKDAAKGAYYIECLTYQLSKNAWEKFNK